MMFHLRLLLSFLAMILITSEAYSETHFEAPSDKSTVCLSMVVKNDATIIERCLKSVQGIVDYISIYDIGSTDDTKDIIRKFLISNHIPGQIYEHQCSELHNARTFAFESTRKILQDLGFSLFKTYLLVIDPNMIVEVLPTFRKDTLTHDSYLIRQKEEGQSYHERRLIRASLPWKARELMHASWDCEQSVKEEHLPTLQIQIFEGNKDLEAQYKRNIEILTEIIKKDPHHSRNIFHLAQSYKHLKQFKEAINAYEACIALRKDPEEIWYSKWMIGKIYEELGFGIQALPYYLEAHACHPNRAEPLCSISQYYRWQGQNHLAYLFAKQASLIPYPETSLFLVADSVYDYEIDQEISIAAYYTPYKEEGLTTTNRLILKRDVPGYIKERTYRNLLYYVSYLKDTQFQPIQIALPPIRDGMNEYFDLMNTSILKTINGYQCICRTVNYDRSQHFKSRDPFDPCIRSRNFLIDYDSDFHLLSQKEIIEAFPRSEGSCVQGLEDCRPFIYEHQLWFMCATFGTHLNHLIGQTLCKLSDYSSDSVIGVEKFIPLKTPNPYRHEKNWLPFVKNGDLLTLYLYDPFTIYKINMQTGEHDLLTKITPKHDFSRFRGSAAPIPFDDGYLMLVHEVISDSRDHYLHRFIFLDKELNMNKLSKPFIFKHKGVEYCTGMTTDHSGTRCIMPISIEDREAWICSVPLNTIRSLLEPLPDL